MTRREIPRHLAAAAKAAEKLSFQVGAGRPVDQFVEQRSPVPA